MSAYGGRGTGNCGAAGTVYMIDQAHPGGVLIIDNDNLVSTVWTVVSALSSNDVVGDVVIRNGGRFAVADERMLIVNGSWNNAGVFIAATNGTVHFATKSAVTISGNNTFGVISTASGKTINFTVGSQTTVLNALKIRDATLQSTVAGQVWFLNLQQPLAENDIKLVKVQDSDASGGVIVDAYASEDLGNNLNWNIMAPKGTIFMLK